MLLWNQSRVKMGNSHISVGVKHLLVSLELRLRQ